MMLRSGACAPSRGLTKKFIGLFTASALLCVFATTAFAKKEEETPFDRNLDVEIGGGLVLGIENDTTIDDTYLVQMHFVIPIHNKLDLELGGGYIDGEDPDAVGVATSPDDPGRDNEYDNWFAGGGVRWYPNSNAEDRVRFYLMLGFQFIDDLKGPDTNPDGWYLGPGLRMRAGDNSGVTLKLPLWFSHEGQTNTLLMPSVNFFYQF